MPFGTPQRRLVSVAKQLTPPEVNSLPGDFVGEARRHAANTNQPVRFAVVAVFDFPAVGDITDMG